MKLQLGLLGLPSNMVGGIFFPGGGNGFFPRGAKSDEILFYRLETKSKTCNY